GREQGAAGGGDRADGCAVASSRPLFEEVENRLSPVEVAELDQRLRAVCVRPDRLVRADLLPELDLAPEVSGGPPPGPPRQLEEAQHRQRICLVPGVALGCGVGQELAHLRPSLVGPAHVRMDEREVVERLAALAALPHLFGQLEVLARGALGTLPVPCPELELRQVAERVWKGGVVTLLDRGLPCPLPPDTGAVAGALKLTPEAEGGAEPVRDLRRR